MLNINLVPEVKKEQARVRQINTTVTALAVLTGGVLLVTVLFLGSMLGYRNAKIASTNRNIAKLEDELKAYKELEESVLTLQQGLADIKEIIAGGRNWTNFYGEIEKATPADIQFVNFKVAGNTVNAEVKGKDVRSIDRFIKSFSSYEDSSKNKLFANVTVDGYTTKDNGEVSFQAKFDVVGEAK